MFQKPKSLVCFGTDMVIKSEYSMGEERREYLDIYYSQIKMWLVGDAKMNQWQNLEVFKPENLGKHLKIN